MDSRIASNNSRGCANRNSIAGNRRTEALLSPVSQCQGIRSVVKLSNAEDRLTKSIWLLVEVL